MSKGVRIGHSAEELEPDTDIVLTLRDTSVLSPDATLESSLLTEHFKAEKKQEIKKLVHSTQVRSQGHDHSYGFEPSSHTLLAKYDDPLAEAEERGFDLDEMGQAQIKQETPTQAAPGISLNTPKTVASEFATFKRPRKRQRGPDILSVLSTAPRTSMRDSFLTNKVSSSVPSPPISLDEDSQDLQVSLARQLRASQKRQEPDPIPLPAVPESVGIVFTKTQEFVDAVASEKDRLESRRRMATGLTLKDTVGGTTSVVDVTLPSERIQEDSLNAAESALSKATEPVPTTTEPNVSNPQEVFMGRGLAECLLLLRQRAELKQNKKTFGRANDVKKEATEDSGEAGGPQLEYRDKKGRLLSKKQAFREQCYIFHNEHPSKNKTEKLLKRAKIEDQVTAMDSSKGSASFRTQKDVMAKTKQPYVVLSSNQ